MLLSINPEHVANILNGTKTFEFRKRKCKDTVDRIIIYSTAPEKAVVAEAVLGETITGAPREVWDKTERGAGISYDFFEAYYEGKDTAVAYELAEIIPYDKPKQLSEFGVQYAPQSFVYIETAA
jgi:predicted transcriptional regulator